MASVRGMDGSATYAATAIANLKSWTMDDGIGVIDVTVKGDAHQQVKGGVTSGSAKLTCVLDAVTGQLALINLLATATPAGAPGSLVVKADATKTWTVNALFTHWSIVSPEGDNPCTVELDFVTSGAIAMSWA